MPNIFVQNTKIKDVGGRSRYITDSMHHEKDGRIEYITGASGKQEEVITIVNHMSHSWSFHSLYEVEHQHQEGQTQNEAREMIIALPNELASQKKNETTEQQKEELQEIITDIADELGLDKHDYEAAVHWNHDRTNLHVHLLYSERPNRTEAEIKYYKKDIWMDKDTHRLAKPYSVNSELVHKTGDIQYDKDGNIKYVSDPLAAKDRRFQLKEFKHEQDLAIQKVLDGHGYHLDIYDRTGPYLSQRKVGKYTSNEYKEYAKSYNEAVKNYNKSVKEHLSIEPERKPEYVQIKKDVEKEVKRVNHEDKKFSTRAIEAIDTMTNKVKTFVEEAKKKINTEVQKVSNWWNSQKEQLLDMFKEQLEGNNGTGTRNVNDNESTEFENQRTGRSTQRVSRDNLTQRVSIATGVGQTREDSERTSRLRDVDRREQDVEKPTRRIKIKM